MKKIDVVLIDLHDQIDYDICNLINLLKEIDDLYFNKDLPAYTIRIYLNYIYLSELSYSIKEYFTLKNLIIHKF